MALRLISPPTALPVSLADAKAHLKVEHGADDALIAVLIGAAARAAEQQLNRALMSQTWQLIIDAFPAAEIRLPMPRVQQIVSIQYVDAAGTLQSLAPTAYRLDADFLPGWALLSVGGTWPATREQANAVQITFVSGYGNDPADVPPDVRLWVLLHVGTAYANRESIAAGLAMNELPGRFADGLLDAQRLYW